MTVVLLMAMGILGLYTNRAAIMEQRLSANEIRTKQAFAAANGGLDDALAYMRHGGIYSHATPIPVPNNVVHDFGLNTLVYSNGGQLTYYRVVYCDSSAIPACPSVHTSALTCATPPTNLGKIAIVSCGWSDDDSSVQHLVQLTGLTPSLAGSVSTPLVTRGAANLLTGGATIMNYFNDLTVWSGESLLGQSNTGKTFIHDETTASSDFRDVGNSPACNNPPSGYQCSTQGSTMGHDTVTGDTNLSSMSVSDFFQYTFGQTPNSYRDTTATWVVDPGGVLSSSDAASISSIENMQDNAIWIEGNATGLPDIIGTQEHPVILIVNGNLELSANSVINGLVYVVGDITGNGSPTIYGGLISSGNANATGNLKVIYDPNVLGIASQLGRAAKLQGGWRDW